MEKKDGQPFTYGPSKPDAVGLLGTPQPTLKALVSGPQVIADAVFVVRKCWFTAEPEAQGELIVAGKKYLVTLIRNEDEVSYEFALLFRGNV